MSFYAGTKMLNRLASIRFALSDIANSVDRIPDTLAEEISQSA
jgi:hypothetical protein